MTFFYIRFEPKRCNVGNPANSFLISFRNANFMIIRTVADVAITEVTIWQQCGYNVPRQEGRENEKYLISEYLYRNGSSFIIWIINYSFCCLYLYIIVSENSPY
jgi:hypothetical protein